LRWAGYIARILERRSAYRLSVGKCEGKNPYERPRRRWGDKTNTGCVGMDWIDVTQDRDRLL